MHPQGLSLIFRMLNSRLESALRADRETGGGRRTNDEQDTGQDLWDYHAR